MRRVVFGVIMALGMIVTVRGQEGSGPVWIDMAHMPAMPEGGIAAVPEVDIPARYTPDMVDLVNGGVSSKPIYLWALDLPVFRNERNHTVIKLMSQFALTGIPVRGPQGGWTEQDWQTADALGRAIGTGVVLHESPFHRVQGCTQDLGDNADYAAELAYLGGTCAKLKDLGIAVTAVVLDSECYETPSHLVTVRLDEAFHEVRRHFAWPVPIIWYRNADWGPMLNADCDGVKTLLDSYRTYSPTHTELWLNKWYKASPGLSSPGVKLKDQWGAWVTLGPGYGSAGWTWKLGLVDKDFEYIGRMHKADQRLDFAIVYPHPTRPVSMPESLDAWLVYAKAMQE